MSNNFMKEVAQALGVELGERFDIKSDDLSRGNPFYLTEKGLFSNHGKCSKKLVAKLILGELEVATKKCTPQKGAWCYYIAIKDNVPSVQCLCWVDSPLNHALYNMGNLFQTKESALENVENYKNFVEQVKSLIPWRND